MDFKFSKNKLLYATNPVIVGGLYLYVWGLTASLSYSLDAITQFYLNMGFFLGFCVTIPLSIGLNNFVLYKLSPKNSNTKQSSLDNSITQREQEKQSEHSSEAYENTNQKNQLAKSIEKNEEFLLQFSSDIQKGESKKLGDNFEMFKNSDGKIFLKTTLLGQDKILTFDVDKMIFGNHQEGFKDIRDLDLDTLKTLKDNFDEVAILKSLYRQPSRLSR